MGNLVPRGNLCDNCAHRYSMRVGPSGLLACSRNSHPVAALVEYLLRSGQLRERHDSITAGPGALPNSLVLVRTHQSAGRIWSAWVYLRHSRCGRPGCGLGTRDRNGASALPPLYTSETTLGCMEFPPPGPVRVQCTHFHMNGECLPPGARAVVERTSSNRGDWGELGHR